MKTFRGINALRVVKQLFTKKAFFSFYTPTPPVLQKPSVLPAVCTQTMNGHQTCGGDDAYDARCTVSTRRSAIAPRPSIFFRRATSSTQYAWKIGRATGTESPVPYFFCV